MEIIFSIFLQGILAAKRYSSTLEKRSKSESNLKQSDIALSTPKERNFSSSNNDIIVSGSEVKSPRKYYNTAPARLKPEKGGKIVGDLLRPKSCSCAAIPLNTPPTFNEILPPEVMDSFTEAVRSLEQPEQQQSLPPDCRLNGDASSNLIEIPTVNIFPDDECPSECPMDTEEAPSSHHVSTDTCDSNTSGNVVVKPLLELNILPTLEEVDNKSEENPKSPTESDRKSISLKCCRKPFNGHTFSVSPNQVINISTILDSKFSVRRLVNEFESQSNRQLNSKLCHLENSAAMSTPNSIEITTATLGEDSSKEDGSGQSTSSYESDANSSGDDRVTSKKAETFGCLVSFLRRNHHHNLKSERISKDNSSSLIETPRSYRKSVGDSPSRSRDKSLKEKSYKAKSKWPVGPLTPSTVENEKPEFHTMKTGVVKQRLEAFEAKSTIPLSKQQQSQQQQQHLFLRSHSRSHSATGTSTNYPYETIEPLTSYGHQRKSSLPQLNNSQSSPPDYDSNSLPSRYHNHTACIPDRKGSLDSSGFRTFPNASCRSFTVRGFQNNSKSLFSSSRQKSNNVVGFNPPASGNRQQHGSTHPLTHLPTTYLS